MDYIALRTGPRFKDGPVTPLEYRFGEGEWRAIGDESGARP